MSALAGIARGIDWRAVNAVTIAGVVVGIGAVAMLNTVLAPTLFGLAFALLAVASGYSFDEPAGVVVDVAPIRRTTRIAAHAVVVLEPLGGGLALVVATAIRGSHWSTASLGLAIVGNIVFGFAVAAVGRHWTAEPGRWAAIVVVFGLVALPSIGPIARIVHTVPTAAPPASGLSPDAWWSIVCALSLITIAIAFFGDDSRLLKLFSRTGATDRA